MKRTIPTTAVLMAATLFAAAAAHAQSARAPRAYPPGPSVDAAAWPPGPSGEATAYPPGPSGQAAALTATNVNVVNAPTVTVGNQVTIKEPVRQPLYMQQTSQFLSGTQWGDNQFVVAPPGSRMVIENISLTCTSGTPQPVAAAIFRPGIDERIITLAPAPLAWGSISYSVQTIPVHLLVDDSLILQVYRASTSGETDCSVTFIGYTTPMP